MEQNNHTQGGQDVGATNQVPIRTDNSMNPPAQSKEERQIAREYFKEKGLSYFNIHKEDITKLREFIRYELQTYLPTTDHSRKMDMRLHKERKKDFKFDEGNRLIEGGIWIDGAYFENREGIYFNDYGFIGFCGWADGSNKMPIIEGFIKWVDYLSAQIKLKDVHAEPSKENKNLLIKEELQKQKEKMK